MLKRGFVVISVACGFVVASFCAQKLMPVPVRHQMSKVFSASEISKIEAMLDDTSRKGLPVSHLFPRLQEASVKRVKFEQLVEVLEKRISELERADVLIKGQISKGYRSQKATEDTVMLAELLERGLSANDWKRAFVFMDKGMYVSEAIDRFKLVHILRDGGIISGISDRMLKAFFSAGVQLTGIVVDFALDYPSSRAGEIIASGLLDGDKVSVIKKALKGAHRKEAVKEIIDESRREKQ
ncbi:MAG: hypothetical protein JW803_05565 [Endomicrobiales bacterium]|nr:hypothetical protein [Endomicrobiales bacterium]